MKDSGLIGKTVVGIDINQDEEALRFRCSDESEVIWRTAGDCCSQSWWADGVSLGQLRGHTVTSVTELELPAPKDDRSRQECDAAYGFAITTERGVATLIFRNSSNGYYGGDCFVGQPSDCDEWREITDYYYWSV